MNKIRVAVVGYGNIGKYTIQALEASPDMEIMGVVRRSVSGEQPAELNPYKVVTDITALGKVDVAILATPTRSVEEHAISTDRLSICAVRSTRPPRRRMQCLSSPPVGIRVATALCAL